MHKPMDPRLVGRQTANTSLLYMYILLGGTSTFLSLVGPIAKRFSVFLVLNKHVFISQNSQMN